MRRDWIWGWVAALPSIIVALLAIRSSGLYSDSPLLAVGLTLILASTISTGILWIKNRQSLRKIIHSGGDVELAIRPVSAFWRAAHLFLIFLGMLVLPRLIVEGQAVIEWDLTLIVIGLVSYLWSLQDTAYKSPNDEDRWAGGNSPYSGESGNP